MRTQFDSCSYEELTNCITGRIEWIREADKFLKSISLKEFPHVRMTLNLTKLNNKNEIRRLLKMRRVLKKSRYKNWNSDLLTINGPKGRKENI